MQRFLTDTVIAEVRRRIRVTLARKFPSLPAAAREDIEQDVLLKLTRMARDGKIIENLGSYVWKTVATTALDWLDAQGPAMSLETYLEEGGPGRTPAGLLEASGEAGIEAARHLESLLGRLPRKRRLVLTLYLDGLDLDQTAAYLGWTSAKVRHLLYRGIAQLKKAARGGREKEDEPRDKERVPVAAGVRERVSD